MTTTLDSKAKGATGNNLAILQNSTSVGSKKISNYSKTQTSLANDFTIKLQDKEFIPYINERDSVGKLINSKSQKDHINQEKRDSFKGKKFFKNQMLQEEINTLGKQKLQNLFGQLNKNENIKLGYIPDIHRQAKNVRDNLHSALGINITDEKKKENIEALSRILSESYHLNNGSVSSSNNNCSKKWKRNNQIVQKNIFQNQGTPLGLQGTFPTSPNLKSGSNSETQIGLSPAFMGPERTQIYSLQQAQSTPSLGQYFYQAGFIEKTIPTYTIGVKREMKNKNDLTQHIDYYDVQDIVTNIRETKKMVPDFSKGLIRFGKGSINKLDHRNRKTVNEDELNAEIEFIRHQQQKYNNGRFTVSKGYTLNKSVKSLPSTESLTTKWMKLLTKYGYTLQGSKGATRWQSQIIKDNMKNKQTQSQLRQGNN